MKSTYYCSAALCELSRVYLGVTLTVDVTLSKGAPWRSRGAAGRVPSPSKFLAAGICKRVAAVGLLLASDAADTFGTTA